MTEHPLPSGDRRGELAARLERVRERIDAAARNAGAVPPQLIAVTKYFPADDVRLLAGLGVTDVGENKDQEASAKAADVDDPGLRWHFIGQLQTNKSRSVVRYAHAVHSVDRPGLVTALGKAMAAEQIRRDGQGQPPRPALECFLQVDLRTVRPADASGPAARGGADPAGLTALADAVAATEGLELRGLMAVAPLGEDPADAFARLRELSDRLVADHPGADRLSAGMSADLEAAVAHGATHLRIGSDILGPRPSLR